MAQTDDDRDELSNDFNGKKTTIRAATSPSQAAINWAIEANNRFIERLEEIAEQDQRID
jgi:hypothetical protein